MWCMVCIHWCVVHCSEWNGVGSSRRDNVPGNVRYGIFVLEILNKIIGSIPKTGYRPVYMYVHRLVMLIRT